MTTKQKQFAIKTLAKLNVNKSCIDKFKKNNDVCIFESGPSVNIITENYFEDVYNEKQYIEKKYNCLVYAITHERTIMGDLWDFLIVPKDEIEWKSLVYNLGNNTDIFWALAYVWNKDRPNYSEFGDIVVKSINGELRRIN